MNTIEIRDDNINTEEIMCQIRDNIRKGKENGVYTKEMEELVNKPLQTSCGNLDENLDDDLRYNLDYINSNWNIRVEYNISSHRPILGKLLVWGRRLVHGEVRRYIDTMIGRQSEFNAHTVRVLNRYAKDVDNKINEKINDAITSVSKDVDNKINEKINDAITSVSKDVDNKWRELYDQDITKDSLKHNVEHHGYFINIINKYAAQLSQNNIPKLIEVGVGTATMSIYFSKTFYDVLGIDNDPIIISRAMDTNKRLGGYAKFACLDAFDLQKFFKEKLFDIAFSQGTLEHFDNDTLKKIIDIQLYIAKCVIFSVPSINYPDGEFGNERKMNINEWEILLKGLGYTIEHISYYQEGDWHVVGVILP